VLTDSISGLVGLHLAASRPAQVRTLVAIGDASAPHQVAYQTTHALAGQLGLRPVVVPGDHETVTRHPEGFAAILHRLLHDSST
jgi:hypothetical protein